MRADQFLLNELRVLKLCEQISTTPATAKQKK
jgi:hypothetical protein